MISLCYLAFTECAVMRYKKKKMHYWCVVIRDAFFSVQIMTYFLLTMPWNIATEGCFSAQGNCIQFHTLLSIYHNSSWALLKRSHLCQYSFNGESMEPKYFSFLNHTFCSLSWIFFKFQMICGSFMLLPHFIYFIFYKNKPSTVLPLRR